MRVIGIDPGSKSFDLFGYNTKTDEIFLESSFPTKRIVESPELLIEILTSVEPFDKLVAPSGFGLPIKKVQELTDYEIFQMILRKPDTKPAMGLQSVLNLLRKSPWDAIVIPGVKHLPTVPNYRKINRIDLGTADKICSAIVGIRDIMDTEDISCEKVNYILIEMGAAFSAVLGIENGQIIDGIGGSNILGFEACGALDGELAYLMGDITKKKIYSGGIASIVGYNALSPEEIFMMAKRDSHSAMALNAYIDSLTKGIYSIYSSFRSKKSIQAILLSGRLVKESDFVVEIQKHIENIAPVRLMKTFSRTVKHSAQGAAFIADGLNHGKNGPIVENLQLTKASGTILDYLYTNIDFNEKDNL